MKSVMKHEFSRVPHVDIQRSTFDRSCGLKTSFDAGYLVPIFVDEALPGDTFNVKATLLARMNTPAVPFFDNLFLDTFFFAIPNRLLWTNWKRFCGEQDNPSDSVSYTIPTMTSTAGTGYLVNSLHDYFGIPIGVPGLEHSSLWHRGYNMIWNQDFRDENLQDSVVVDTGDGPDDPADYVLLRRGKRHDYFTSCLPWPQKFTAPDLPLGTSAPVYGDGNTLGLTDGTYTMGLTARNTSAGQLDQYDQAYNQAIPFTVSSFTASSSSNKALGVVTSGASGLIADLSSATASTINELRRAFQIQRFLERQARGGTRYPELILSMFHVSNPDARMQRAEYLGGSSAHISIHPVQQTSATDTGTSSGSPQGNLAAYGICVDSQPGFVKSFTEHCIIIGLVNVRADLTYQQGLHRMFSRQTIYDFYWPPLAHLGEQAVLNKEIYAQGTADDDLVFGYQEAFADYRYKPSLITGSLRSTAATNYDFWHLAEEFGSLPVLNDSFIQDNPPIDRIVSVTTEPDFFLDAYFKNICARPMPVYSVPGYVDHF